MKSNSTSKNPSVHQQSIIEQSVHCEKHENAPISHICINTICEYGRQMCSKCSHPQCDPEKLRTLREFSNMVKVNLQKDDANKLVYYDSGAYLKDFKSNFAKAAERQRDEMNKQFDSVIKLIEGIQQAPLSQQNEIQLLKICSSQFNEELLLKNFDTCLKIAGDKNYIKGILQQRGKMAELKTKTLDAYDTDMKLLQNNWGGEFQKLKEKYFTLVNKKQEQEEKPRQIVISFGNWHQNDSFAEKLKEWQIHDFEQVDIDDVSVEDHINLFKTSLDRNQIILKIKSGPVLLRVMKKLLPQEKTKPEKLKIKFTLYGVIFDSPNIDLLRAFNKLPVPQLAFVHNALSEKRYQQLQLYLKELTKVPSVIMDFEKSDRVGILQQLKEMKQLVKLDLNLQENKINKASLMQLGQCLRTLKLINDLNINLKENELGEEGTQAFAAFLPELNQLQHLKLNLWSNNLKENGAKYLSYALKDCNQSLISLELVLCFNNMGEKGMEHISKGLMNFKVISYIKLNLWNNNITSKGVQHLGSTLSTMGNIKQLELDLWFNNITDRGVLTLGKSLSHLSQIQKIGLNLRSNAIEDEDIKQMMEEIKILDDLRELNLNVQQTKIRDQRKLKGYVNQKVVLNII